MASTTKNTETNTPRCARCARVLTSTTSIARGIGPGCATILRREARAEYRAHQIESARELIADGGIAHLRSAVYLTVSTDGTRVHRTTTTHCTCDAGIRNGRCYHSAAVRIITALSLARPARPAHTLAA